MAKKQSGFSIAQSILFSILLVIFIGMITLTVLESISFNRSTVTLIEEQSKEINKQVILNYESYIDSVIETANYIQEKTTEYGLADRMDELSDIYTNAADIQADIVTIILIDISGNVIATSTNQTVSNDLTLKSYYIDALDESTIYHFSSPHIQDAVDDSNEQVITVTKLVNFYNDNLRQTGILIVDINSKRLDELAQQSNFGDGGHIVILNNDNSLVYSNYDTCIDNSCTSSQVMQDIIFGGETVTVDEIEMYANVNTLGNTRWKIGTFINVEIISETRNQTLVLAVMIFGFTLVISSGISLVIARRISNPIHKLQSHMKFVEQGDFLQKIEIEGQREVVDLGHSFNRMQEEIRALMETVLIEQKEKRKSEFLALQTQINPHFLYNTLDSIVYLSENEMNDKVQEMVIALSKFFRISISRGKNIIPLSEELEHAKNYLLIQQIRYNDKFDFKFEIEDETKDLRIVKLVLQPIIENAIYHGINTEFDKGSIIIRSFIKEDKLILEVEDDGYGIPEKKIKELYENMYIEQKQASVGLRNVYQRLNIYYGDQMSFEIDSELDERTIMRLIIPIERAL